MDESTALTARLDDFDSSTQLDAGLLSVPLTALTHHLRRTISSYLGLELVIEDLGHQIVVSAFEPAFRPIDITTSLWLAVETGGADPTLAGMTLYAATPGTFVDLAADRAFSLRRAGQGPGHPPETIAGVAAVRLDEALSPRSTSSGVIGVAELAKINRAVGLLIDRGHTEPELDLVRDAARDGTSTYAYASRLLRPDPP